MSLGFAEKKENVMGPSQDCLLGQDATAGKVYRVYSCDLISPTLK